MGTGVSHKRAALAEATRRKDALANEQRRHEAVLAAQADDLRRHEAVVLAAQADEHCRHEAMLVKAADKQRWRESAACTTKSNAVIERIRTEIALCAAPLDAILAEIACEEAAFLMTAEFAKQAKAADDAATRAANSAALALVEKHCRNEAMLAADTDVARRRTSYVDAVLFNMGGGHTTIFAPRCLAFGSRASGSTII